MSTKDSSATAPKIKIDTVEINLEELRSLQAARVKAEDQVKQLQKDLKQWKAKVSSTKAQPESKAQSVNDCATLEDLAYFILSHPDKARSLTSGEKFLINSQIRSK
jgi:uncharacterized protein YlxW (UPF0749 family)